MAAKSPQNLTRRELLRASIRYAILAALATAGGTAARNKRISAPQPECINRGICARCRAFAQCDLPRAVLTRETSYR